MKKIALVAAADRNNYGDVFLPMIYEQYMKKNHDDEFEFYYYALFESDLSNIGGKMTLPISRLDDKIDVVIFVGGEILYSNYISSHINLNPGFATIFIERILRRFSFSRNLLNRYLKEYIFGCKFDMPWMYQPATENQIVFYNSAGGINFSDLTSSIKQSWIETIDRSDMFSVRDKSTFSQIEAIGNSKISLVPDTAIIISELFTDKDIFSLCTNNIVNLTSNLSQKYYVLQVNKKIGIPHVSMISDAINKIYDNYGLVCVLLPIGRAAGHDDIIPLTIIKNNTNNASILIENNNIYDVVCIIKNSLFYVGSSLHGAITAMSFNVPHVALSSQSIKLINYLDTWRTSFVKVVDNSNDIYNFCSNVLNGTTLVDENKVYDMKKNVAQMLNDEYLIIKSK